MLCKLVTCLLVAGGLQVSAGQIERDQGKQGGAYAMSVLRPVGFNYLIYADELLSPEQPFNCSRNVYVLMEEDAFSETNLRDLFKVLSEAFPKPKALSVMVRTSLEQVRPLDPMGASEQPDLPNANKHHYAAYVRMGDNEFFRYIAHPPEGTWTTVVLKGVDPAADHGR